MNLFQSFSEEGPLEIDDTVDGVITTNGINIDNSPIKENSPIRESSPFRENSPFRESSPLPAATAAESSSAKRTTLSSKFNIRKALTLSREDLRSALTPDKRASPEKNQLQSDRAASNENLSRPTNENSRKRIEMRQYLGKY